MEIGYEKGLCREGSVLQRVAELSGYTKWWLAGNVRYERLLDKWNRCGANDAHRHDQEYLDTNESRYGWPPPDGLRKCRSPLVEGVQGDQHTPVAGESGLKQPARLTKHDAGRLYCSV